MACSYDGGGPSDQPALGGGRASFWDKRGRDCLLADDRHARRLQALLSWLCFVLNLRAFIQALETGTFDLGEMHEHVFAAVSGPFASTMYHLFVDVTSGRNRTHAAFLAYQLLPPEPADPDQRTLVFVRSLWVDKAYRRRGYARALARRLLELYPPGIYRWRTNIHTPEGDKAARALVREFGPFPAGALTLTREALPPANQYEPAQQPG